LGVDHELDEVGWFGSGVEKLWRYNQHYFDDLNAIGASDRRDWHAGLIARWLSDNPAPQGDGWDPYPLSLGKASPSKPGTCLSDWSGTS
jgi:hypothetical protein